MSSTKEGAKRETVVLAAVTLLLHVSIRVPVGDRSPLVATCFHSKARTVLIIQFLIIFKDKLFAQIGYIQLKVLP